VERFDAQWASLSSALGKSLHHATTRGVRKEKAARGYAKKALLCSKGRFVERRGDPRLGEGTTHFSHEPPPLGVEYLLLAGGERKHDKRGEC